MPAGERREYGATMAAVDQATVRESSGFERAIWRVWPLLVWGLPVAFAVIRYQLPNSGWDAIIMLLVVSRSGSGDSGGGLTPLLAEALPVLCPQAIAVIVRLAVLLVVAGIAGAIGVASSAQGDRESARS